jgi:hypothetical protein
MLELANRPGADWLLAQGDDVTPIWTKLIVDAALKIRKTCTHCKRSATYQRKKPGQFYKCRHCGHRFKEKS